MAAGIDRDQLRQLIGAGAQLIEVLPVREYEEDHLPGARSIPLKTLDRTMVATLDPKQPIIVYCWDIA
jgi:rhodanese-related sulfurtransferase